MRLKLINKLMLILFSIVLFFIISFTACFGILFLQHADKVENNRLETKALSLADILSKATPDNTVATIYNNTILNLVNTLNQNEVWIIDKTTLQISGSQSYPHLLYNQLTETSAQDLQKVFAGQIIRTDSFSAFTNPEYTTVGVPIYDKNQQVKAALLLHDRLPTLKNSWYDGIPIMALCLVILFILSAFLLYKLIKKCVIPLTTVNKFIEKIIAHDYDLRIQTEASDEIATLVQNINKLADYVQSMEKSTDFKEKSMTNLVMKTAYKLHTPLKDLKFSLSQLTLNNSNVDKATLAKMTNNIENMERIANNLLNLSQLNNADFTMTKSLLNLTEVLTDSVDSLTERAKTKNIHMETHIELEKQLILFTGDYERLKQMFCETLEKAIQLYPKDSTIDINVMEDSDHYFIFFKNHNTEVSVKQISEVFQQFYKSPSEDNLFSSLELSIARHLASLHGIELSCEKQADDYTTFKFTIKK